VKESLKIEREKPVKIIEGLTEEEIGKRK